MSLERHFGIPARKYQMIISLLLVLCLSPVWGQASKDCKPVPTDVIFVLDSSSSILPSDFQMQLQFVKRFIQDTKTIGIKGTQVGVYTFADTPVLNFPLGIYQDGSSMILAVNNIQQLDGLTNTDLALESVIRDGFSSAFGARPGVQKAVILITDGQSVYQEKTIEAAQTLRKSNIQIFTIGVGDDIDKSELKEIASAEENVYSIVNYSELNKLEKSVNKVICETTLCSIVPVDVVFVLDSSSSLKDPNFKNEIDFVTAFVDHARIGPKHIQISLFTFADKSNFLIKLNDFENKNELLQKLRNIQRDYGFTNTDVALNDVRMNAFSSVNGGRGSGAKQVVIVLTDGESMTPEATKEEARKLHSLNIEVFSVGIGSEVDVVELHDIASEINNVRTVPDFEGLKEIEKRIIKKVCVSDKVVSTPTPVVCETRPADVIFVLDSSDSVKENDFKKYIEFVTKFVSSANIGPQNVQVGVFLYADDSSLFVRLGELNDKAKLVERIRNMKRIHGGTYTDKALQDVRARGFTAVNGGRGSGVNQIAIVITDGESLSPDDTKAAAQALRAMHVKLYAVGVGETNVAELHAISSGINNVFTVPDFKSLSVIENELFKKVCSKQPISTIPPKICKTKPADVIFVLDSSDSVKENDFKKYIAFVTKFVSSANIGPQNVQVGVFLYADDSSLFVRLGELNDKAKLVERIRNMKRIHGGTYTDKALQDVRARGFTAVNGGRGSGVNQIAIVITDGESLSPDDTKAAAQALRAMHVKLYAVGVGETNVAELHAISSGVNNVFTVPDFKSLSTIENELFKKVCSRQPVDGGGTTPSGGNTGDHSSTISPNSKCNKESKKMADVVILVDNSDSVSDDLFTEEIMMVNKLIASHTIGPQDVQVAVVTFGDKANEVYNLKQNVGYFRRSKGSTNTAGALNLAMNKSFLPSSGARPASHKVVIVVTDGTSDDEFETQKAARALRASGVNILCIGVGNGDLFELRKITGDPSKVFMAADSSGIDMIGDKIFDGDCGPLKA